MAFQYAGASATGRGHLEAGTPCEDAHHIIPTADGIVACVSDGAGSASRSATGAATLVSKICSALVEQIGSLGQPGIMHTLVSTIQDTREELEALGPLSDFHATLCGIVLSGEQCLVFHLGDGVVMGINPDDWSDFVVSEPRNGEFAETTYFFTLPQWRQSLRVFAAPRRFRTWFLMSDGAASFAVKTSPWRPTANFLEPVHRHLCGLKDVESRNQALLGTLQSPEADRITADDKTLVWVHDQGKG